MIKANSHEIEIEANYLKLLQLSVGPSANHVRGLLFLRHVLICAIALIVMGRRSESIHT